MKILSIPVILALLAYLFWPYTQLYRLDLALAEKDSTVLDQMIDLEAIRVEIKRKMNKDVESAVGDVSGAFVDWLQDGIRRLGDTAVDRLVTMGWVTEQLSSKAADRVQPTFIPYISYAFFEGLDSFLVRIGDLGESPVHFRMTRQGLDWRITALYN